MAKGDKAREQAAEEHAFRVLEERNKAFRVLYDTVLAVEGEAEEKIFSILCHNLRRISNAAWAALASYNSNSGILTLEVLDTETQEILLTDKGSHNSIHIPTNVVNELIEVQIKNCVEHGSTCTLRCWL